MDYAKVTDKRLLPQDWCDYEFWQLGFNPTEVKIVGFWLFMNSPPAQGEPRINYWDPDLEQVPPYCQKVHARQRLTHGWL